MALAVMLFVCVRFIDIEILVLPRAPDFACVARRTYINPTGDIVNTFFVGISRTPNTWCAGMRRAIASSSGKVSACGLLDKTKGFCYSRASLESAHASPDMRDSSDFDYLLVVIPE
jgi:hypothetical protein